MNTTKEVIQSVSTIWQCTLDTVRAVKELDVLMKQMDISQEKYLQDSNVSLAKFQHSAHIMEKLLDNISKDISNTLDKALSIDSKNCEMKDLENRSQLITLVRVWSDNLSSMMMKLMSI